MMFAAAAALAGCDGGSAPAGGDRTAEAPHEEAREGETVIRADGNGAFVDTGAGEIRVGRNGVDVDLDGGEIEARIRTGEDPSISVTTNRR